MVAKKAKRGGMPEFVPTKDDRKRVMLTAGRMSQDEICLVILNPRTGMPINKETLARVFKQELAVGKVKLRMLTSIRFYEALDHGESWAIKMAMWNEFRISDRVDAFSEIMDKGAGAPGTKTSIEISFVAPEKRNGHANGNGQHP